jgi:O-antigen/teichoic acid export membrane protein
MGSKKIIENSLWLIVQPIVLNVISIAVVGYIARTLGQADYGKFVFSIAFIYMFMPLANMGLRGVTVRDLAKDRSRADILVGKMIAARFLLALIAVVFAILSITVMAYPPETKLIVSVASLIIIFQAVSTTCLDAFQAFEKMRYIAYTQFIAGLVLTILSVPVLLVGFGILGLVWVYVFGSLLAAFISYALFCRHIAVPKLAFDCSYIKGKLIESMAFFFPSFIAIVGRKIDIVILSVMAGDASVGIYGAANSIVERLTIIPDGVCTAMYPSMVNLFQDSAQKAGELFQRFFSYMIIIGLPIAIGITVLAKSIIHLIYGGTYSGAVLLLQLLIWWLFITFLTMLQGWTLNAIHKEKKGALVSYISTPLYVLLNLILIPNFKEVGVAISAIVSALVSMGMFSFFIKRFLVQHSLSGSILVRVIGANLLMGGIVFMLDEFPLYISIPSGVFSYIAMVIAFKLLRPDELTYIKKLIMLKLGLTTVEVV